MIKHRKTIIKKMIKTDKQTEITKRIKQNTQNVTKTQETKDALKNNNTKNKQTHKKQIQIHKHTNKTNKQQQTQQNITTRNKTTTKHTKPKADKKK